MRRIFFFLLVFIFIAGCTIPDNSSDPGLGDYAVFSVPTSMTGTSTSRAARAITDDTKAQVDGFFEYARDQVRFANDAGQGIKSIINDIDESGAFALTSSIVIESSNGDRIAWTVGPDGDLIVGEYLLEWWRYQGAGASTEFVKLFELKLNEYIQSPEIEVSGTAILYPAADSATLSSWHGEPDYVLINFDNGDAQGNQVLHIEMQNFLGQGLYQGDSAQNFQNGILDAVKTPEGLVDVYSSVKVPGLFDLNYEFDGTTLSTASDATTETRYYLFSGRDVGGKATVNLSMPLPDAYLGSNNDVFDGFEDTIGGIITEYVCDGLRATSAGNTLIDDLSTYSSYTFSGPYLNGENPNPSNTDIKAALEEVFPLISDPANKEELENYLYLMSVSNPAYFEANTYVDFGDTVPEGYQDATDPNFTVFAIAQTAVEGLNISFTYPSTNTAPPDLTNP